MKANQGYPNHLAWHETLELHELVAMQASQLAAIKRRLPTLTDPAVRTLYTEAARGLEQNITELLRFYPQAPSAQHRDEERAVPAAEAGHLLGFSKSAVRNYALAITEAATPQLRETFQRHLMNAIALHGRVFHFMYERGYYPAYNLQQLLANDVAAARAALAL